jgi:hypothetical protein
MNSSNPLDIVFSTRYSMYLYKRQGWFSPAEDKDDSAKQKTRMVQPSRRQGWFSLAEDKDDSGSRRQGWFSLAEDKDGSAEQKTRMVQPSRRQ